MRRAVAVTAAVTAVLLAAGCSGGPAAERNDADRQACADIRTLRQGLDRGTLSVPEARALGDKIKKAGESANDSTIAAGSALLAAALARGNATGVSGVLRDLDVHCSR